MLALGAGHAWHIKGVAGQANFTHCFYNSDLFAAVGGFCCYSAFVIKTSGAILKQLLVLFSLLRMLLNFIKLIWLSMVIHTYAHMYAYIYKYIHTYIYHMYVWQHFKLFNKVGCFNADSFFVSLMMFCISLFLRI